jgi:hypothetical protein
MSQPKDSLEEPLIVRGQLRKNIMLHFAISFVQGWHKLQPSPKVHQREIRAHHGH